MPAWDDEPERPVRCRAVCCRAVDGDVRRVERLDAADEGVVPDVAARGLVRRVAFQLHEPGEARVGVRGVAGPERIDDDAAEGMVGGDAPGGIDPTETDDERERGQLRRTRCVCGGF